MKYLILIISLILLSGCGTMYKGIDGRGLHGRVLVDPVYNTRYLVEDKIGGGHYLHEMLPGGNGVIYHK